MRNANLILMTSKRHKRESDEEAIYREWQRLKADPRNNRSVIVRYLSERYSKTERALYYIFKRVERRIDREEAV